MLRVEQHQTLRAANLIGQDGIKTGGFWKWQEGDLCSRVKVYDSIAAKVLKASGKSFFSEVNRR